MLNRKFFNTRLSKPLNTNSMNCKKCRHDLIGFIRGTLEQGQEVRIREHLRVCAECRTFANYLRTTLNVIQAEKEIAPDPFLATRIEGILSNAALTRQRFSFMPKLIPALTFSTFILAGIAGGMVLGRLITHHSFDDQLAQNELTILIDDMQQEPIETFFMGLNEMAEN